MDSCCDRRQALLSADALADDEDDLAAAPIASRAAEHVKTSDGAAYYLVMFLNLAFWLSFMGVLPVLFFDIQHDLPRDTHAEVSKLYGWSLAAFSFVFILAAPFCGWWYARAGLRAPLLFATGGTVVGFAVYCGARNVATIIAARAIAGVSGGVVALAPAVIQKIESDERMASAMASLPLINTFGAMVGPVFGLFLSVGKTSDAQVMAASNSAALGWLKINAYTLPGFVSMWIFVLCFLGVLHALDAVPPQKSAAASEAEERPPTAQQETALWVLLLAMTIMRIVVGTLEATLTPYTHANYGWFVADNSFIFVATGAAMFAGGIMGKQLALRRPDLTDYGKCVAGETSILIGVLLVNDWGHPPLPKWRLVMGCACILIAFPIVLGNLMTMQAKLFRSTTWAARLTVGTGMGRLLGPIVSTQTLHFSYRRRGSVQPGSGATTCDAQDFYRQAGKCVERCSDETAFSIMVALQLLVILALLFVRTTLHKPTPTPGPEAARAPELQLSQLEADDAGGGEGGQ